MSKNNIIFNTKNKVPDWVTIREAVKIANELTSTKIKDSDIYRHALYGNITLSIYFQSPTMLRKVKISNFKVYLHSIDNSLIHRICLLDRNCFISGRTLIASTIGSYVTSTQRVIDTALVGYEYVLIQRLLARALGIPLPVVGAKVINYGISVTLAGEVFQIFEKVTWQERLKRQIMQLPENISPNIYKIISRQSMQGDCHKDYFPIHDLPQDACFVIRYAELEKLLNMPVKGKGNQASPTRISTPLSRLFWLSCKHNETISPLIRQPYKLLSIFEQWASTDGITDRLSGDTLKTALERGSPTSISAKN
ncbi:hypothetical protein ACL2XQ_09790 [Sodalis sp. RH14]|uniref:hypothetical protein n=1 Tax=Sodalis sp. RH14 TaxID=3394329 RepID=UPI0039B5BB0F